jgi:hypothetical protein
MILEEGRRIFASPKEAEEFIETTYVGKIVTFWYWHRRKEKMMEKTEKVDRVSIDMSKHIPQVLLFFVDGTKNEFDKDDFFNDVKIIT